ncbi:MAG: type II toxin-antitoxin system RelE/ParE family toxin [Candidatus Peribacteraceae bacterium]|nr:type II toxin-antitoxin system RelE/ParE family toxin [Candidatus Peribacteraceae bacterium]
MYAVVLKKRAEKDIAALRRKDQQRVLSALDVLRENPFAGKRLQGEYEGAWSLRIWPYRIIYVIHRRAVTVVVLRVGHRQGVYGK